MRTSCRTARSRGAPAAPLEHTMHQVECSCSWNLVGGVYRGCDGSLQPLYHSMQDHACPAAQNSQRAACDDALGTMCAGATCVRSDEVPHVRLLQSARWLLLKARCPKNEPSTQHAPLFAAGVRCAPFWKSRNREDHVASGHEEAVLSSILLSRVTKTGDLSRIFRFRGSAGTY